MTTLKQTRSKRPKIREIEELRTIAFLADQMADFAEDVMEDSRTVNRLAEHLLETLSD